METAPEPPTLETLPEHTEAVPPRPPSPACGGVLQPQRGLWRCCRCAFALCEDCEGGCLWRGDRVARNPSAGTRHHDRLVGSQVAPTADGIPHRRHVTARAARRPPNQGMVP